MEKKSVRVVYLRQTERGRNEFIKFGIKKATTAEQIKKLEESKNALIRAYETFNERNWGLVGIEVCTDGEGKAFKLTPAGIIYNTLDDFIKERLSDGEFEIIGTSEGVQQETCAGLTLVEYGEFKLHEGIEGIDVDGIDTRPRELPY